MFICNVCVDEANGKYPAHGDLYTLYTWHVIPDQSYNYN